MPADPIAFVRWHPATEPPWGDGDNQVWTQPIDGSRPCAAGAHYVSYRPERFALWCAPLPPVESEYGPLTMDDLDALATMPGASTGTHDGGVLVAFPQEQWVAWHAAAARLRHAIESMEVDRG